MTDKNSGVEFLVDTGADLCVFPRRLVKGRRLKTSYVLEAVNNTEIATYVSLDVIASLLHFSNKSFSFFQSPATKAENKDHPKRGLAISYNSLYSVNCLYKNDTCIFIFVKKNPDRFMLGFIHSSPLQRISDYFASLAPVLKMLRADFLNIPVFIAGEFNACVGNLNKLPPPPRPLNSDTVFLARLVGEWSSDVFSSDLTDGICQP